MLHLLLLQLLETEKAHKENFHEENIESEEFFSIFIILDTLSQIGGILLIHQVCGCDAVNPFSGRQRTK